MLCCLTYGFISWFQLTQGLSAAKLFDIPSFFFRGLPGNRVDNSPAQQSESLSFLCRLCDFCIFTSLSLSLSHTHTYTLTFCILFLVFNNFWWLNFSDSVAVCEHLYEFHLWLAYSVGSKAPLTRQIWCSAQFETKPNSRRPVKRTKSPWAKNNATPKLANSRKP